MYGYFVDGSYKGDLPYTDLAIERRRADSVIPGIEYWEEKRHKLHWERVKISTKTGADSIGRPIGIYDTISCERFDRLDNRQVEEMKDEMARELCCIFEECEIFPGRILVAGLGNPDLTPDSLGAKTTSAVRSTMHIKDCDRKLFTSLNCAEIASVIPDVASNSGLDAAVVIKGICDLILPDAVIAIDALATREIKRLGCNIQISSSGISPGSGLGNCRTALCHQTVGVPVFAIGVPTVIDARSLIHNQTLNGEPMFVSPKEIGEIVSVSASIISEGINRAFGILY